jgi:phospholipase D
MSYKHKSYPYRYLLTAVICSLILCGSYVAVEIHKHQQYHYPADKLEVCFTPNRKCQQLIIKHLDAAQQSIRIQAYSFTDPEITNALIRAKKRDVSVQVILDKSNVRNRLLPLLLNNDIDVRIDAPAGIAHNKIIIIDEKVLITGSYNFSKAAYSRNTENLLIIRNEEIVKQYLQNYHNRQQQSRLPDIVSATH